MQKMKAEEPNEKNISISDCERIARELIGATEQMESQRNITREGEPVLEPEQEEIYRQLLEDLNLDAGQTAFMGDDVVDLPVMRRTRLAIAVPAAPDLVKAHSHYITRREGGRGAVREACEFIMRAQGTFDAQMALYLE